MYTGHISVLMNFFESRRRQTGQEQSLVPAAQRLRDAQAGFEKAARHEAYTSARLSELLPALNRITALEIEEQSAALAVEHASLDLQLAQAAERRAMTGSASGAHAAEVLKRKSEATAKLNSAKSAHGRISQELERLREDTTLRDAELRRRLGVEL